MKDLLENYKNPIGRFSEQVRIFMEKIVAELEKKVEEFLPSIQAFNYPQFF